MGDTVKKVLAVTAVKKATEADKLVGVNAAVLSYIEKNAGVNKNDAASALVKAGTVKSTGQVHGSIKILSEKGFVKIETKEEVVKEDAKPKGDAKSGDKSSKK